MGDERTSGQNQHSPAPVTSPEAETITILRDSGGLTVAALRVVRCPHCEQLAPCYCGKVSLCGRCDERICNTCAGLGTDPASPRRHRDCPECEGTGRCPTCDRCQVQMLGGAA